jgi:hypothetical protein
MLVPKSHRRHTAPHPQRKATMDYLFLKLWYWVLLAGGIGFVTGWLSCSPRDET